jgi:L-ascorbate metabolism protein UlaG (beta-lactamase superfamily)
MVCAASWLLSHDRKYGNNEGLHMKLKWYGTATILLEQDGVQLLFDPFIPLNHNVYQPPLDELTAISNILLTHGHLDHASSIPAIMQHGDGKSTVYCTDSPREWLISKGVEEKRVHKITPGDILNSDPFEVQVLKGKHIVFDRLLLVKTLLSPRVLANWGNLRYMLKENKSCREAGETVVYYISTKEKSVLLLGSLNLDEETKYPEGADLFILPFQGRSDMSKYAMNIVDRLMPKKVLLDHFDNSFPPISSSVDTEQFISLMKQKYPDTPIICPQAGAAWITI